MLSRISSAVFTHLKEHRVRLGRVDVRQDGRAQLRDDRVQSACEGFLGEQTEERSTRLSHVRGDI
jgi:hypothetical protein